MVGVGAVVVGSGGGVGDPDESHQRRGRGPKLHSHPPPLAGPVGRKLSSLLTDLTQKFPLGEIRVQWYPQKEMEIVRSKSKNGKNVGSRFSQLVLAPFLFPDTAVWINLYSQEPRNSLSFPRRLPKRPSSRRHQQRRQHQCFSNACISQRCSCITHACSLSNHLTLAQCSMDRVGPWSGGQKRKGRGRPTEQRQKEVTAALRTAEGSYVHFRPA